MRILLSVALILLPAAGHAATSFDRVAWQQDFTQLKAELGARYANLAWKASGTSGVDLPALDREATASLASATDAMQASDAIRAFIAGFHDGHLSELPYLAKGTGNPIEPAEPVLDPSEPTAGCAAVGYASTGPVAFSLPLEGLPGFQLLDDGLTTTFRTGLVTRSGVTLGVVRIQNFRARAFPATCVHAWLNLQQSGTLITKETLKDAARLQWFADLAGATRMLKEKGATALVVDVGNNSGGDDSGDWAPRMFTDRPVRSARLMMVDAPVSMGYFDEKISDITDDLPMIESTQARTLLVEARTYFRRLKASVGKQRCDLSWVWRQQRAWSLTACNRLLTAGYAGGYLPSVLPSTMGSEKAAADLAGSAQVAEWYGAWRGPTYVLTDKRSYSSAEMFAAVMQDNRVAKLVGERTGGDGCGFMTEGDPIVLKHSRLRFRVPNCMRLRADGTNEEAGVSPDMPVIPSEGESDRARAERALAVIADDVRGMLK